MSHYYLVPGMDRLMGFISNANKKKCTGGNVGCCLVASTLSRNVNIVKPHALLFTKYSPYVNCTCAGKIDTQKYEPTLPAKITMDS